MGNINPACVSVELFQKEKYFVSPSVKTEIGYGLQWIDSTVMLETSCTDKELGDEIIKAATFASSFKANKMDIERIELERKGSNAYWTRFVGIKNWRSFAKKTEMVSLAFFSDCVRMNRYFQWKNLAFGPISDGSIARFLGVTVTEELINKTKFVFPASITPEEIGNAVKTLFAVTLN